VIDHFGCAEGNLTRKSFGLLRRCPGWAVVPRAAALGY